MASRVKSVSPSEMSRCSKSISSGVLGHLGREYCSDASTQLEYRL